MAVAEWAGMKKQRGKLSINRQTVRNLRGDELRGAAGGKGRFSKFVSFCIDECFSYWNTCPTQRASCGGGCTIA